MNAAFIEWLSERSEIIQRLGRKYPPGTVIEIDGIKQWVVSYFKDGCLGVSEVNPSLDYDRALSNSHVLCKDCAEGLSPMTHDGDGDG